MQKTNQDVPQPSSSHLRCAIYTRKSTEEGLEQEFNSLDAQREAAEAYIQSQRREGWIALPELYDDRGFTGANMDRPALTRLLQAVEAGELDCVVVYKVDRLSRSLLDFTRMLSVFEKHKVSFVAVTQQFNTSTSLGRLTLNILLSFAHYAERAIMQSQWAEVPSQPARQGWGTSHNDGSKREGHFGPVRPNANFGCTAKWMTRTARVRYTPACNRLAAKKLLSPSTRRRVHPCQSEIPLLCGV